MTPSLLLETILDLFGKTTSRKYDAHRERLDRTALIRRLGGAQVLLVEDNAINQRVAQEMLEGIGIAVTLANHGQEAIQQLLERPFDLVFMDLQMPVMGGHQATQQIRSMPPFQKLPIIAMTAHALDGDREACLAAGMNDYIAKPIDLQQLCHLLVRWIPSRGQEASLPPPPPQTVAAQG
ncbi:MAG: response regulator, partial [Magnetococcus sp. XQGC-1]